MKAEIFFGGQKIGETQSILADSTFYSSPEFGAELKSNKIRTSFTGAIKDVLFDSKMIGSLLDPKFNVTLTKYMQSPLKIPKRKRQRKKWLKKNREVTTFNNVYITGDLIKDNFY